MKIGFPRNEDDLKLVIGMKMKENSSYLDGRITETPLSLFALFIQEATTMDGYF